MNPFLDFKPEEDDLSNFAAAVAAKGKKDKLDMRRQAAMHLINKSLAGNQDQMVGGGRTTSFGDRPAIRVAGNTATSVLGGVAEAAAGGYMLDQADEQDAMLAAARDKAFKEALGNVGGASNNVTDIPPDTAMQADPNTVRANLERGMDPQLANATGVPDGALRPAVSVPTDGSVSPAPVQPKGNGDMSVRQLLQLAHDFPENAKSINTLIQAKSWEGRDTVKAENQFELARMRLDSAAQQAAQRVTSAQEMAALRQQYAIELQNIRQQFTSGENAKYRDPAGSGGTGAGGTGPAGATAPKPIKTTESERKAAGFLGRMDAANADPNINVQPSLRQTIVQAVPVVGQTVQALTGTDAENVGRNKQIDWYRAKLRHESGAVIGDNEAYEEAAMYFPRFGDSEAVKASKAQARAQAEEQLRSSAGNATPTRAAPVADARPKPREGQPGKAKDGTPVIYRNGKWVAQ